MMFFLPIASRLTLTLFLLVPAFLWTDVRAEDRPVKVGILIFPPYSFENEEGELVGAAVEVIREAFEVSDQIVEFEVLPYARAVSLAESGETDACGLLNRGTSTKLIYAENTLAKLAQTFFVRKDDAWEYGGIESLADRRVVTVAGYDYRRASSDYQDFLDRNENVSEIDSSEDYLVRIARMISLDRADVFNEAADVMTYALRNAGLDKTLRPAGRLPTQLEVVIGFGLGTRGERLQQAFDKGWKAMLASGRLQEIYAKYQIETPI